MKKEELSAAMSDIDLRFIEEAENYNMSKRKIIKRPLSRVAVAAIIITCIALAGGAAYAGASLTSWESVISFFDKDGNKTEVIVSDEAFFKELPDGLPVPGDGEPMIAMTKNEVEELLGFEILDSDLSTENEINYDASLNLKNDDVAIVDLWCPNFIKENETKHISYSIDILSTEAEEDYILPFIEGKDAMGGKIYVGTYELENLSVDTVVYTSDWMPERLTATFVYDNLYYSFIADNYELEEFLDILETLK